VVGGTPEQRQRFLQPFLATKGAPLAAFALTEPGGSANVGSPSPGQGVRTTARRVGDSWVISGRKHWISAATGWNGEGADLLTVVCRTDANVEPLRGIFDSSLCPRPDSGLIVEHAFDAPYGNITLIGCLDISRIFRKSGSPLKALEGMLTSISVESSKESGTFMPGHIVYLRVWIF